MSELLTYIPHAESWLRNNYGTNYTLTEVESLGYLLAGCAGDGENQADRIRAELESDNQRLRTLLRKASRCLQEAHMEKRLCGEITNALEDTP